MKIARVIYILTLFMVLTSFGPPILTEVFDRPTPDQLSLGEIIDIFTPFIMTSFSVYLLFLIWHQARETVYQFSNFWPLICFILGTVAMVNGHGVHLSSNSLSHALTESEHGSIYQLNFFFDERLSHYLWHIGAFVSSLGLALFQIKHPMREHVSYRSILPAAILYGLVLGFATVEGETVFPLLPLTIITLLGLLVIKNKFQMSWLDRPVVVYNVISYVIMLLWWLGYFLIFGGFPEPTSLL